MTLLPHFSIKDYLTRRVTATANSIGKVGEIRNGVKSSPYLYPKPQAELVGGDLCNYKGSSSNYSDCKVRLIKGKIIISQHAIIWHWGNTLI